MKSVKNKDNDVVEVVEIGQNVKFQPTQEEGRDKKDADIQHCSSCQM